MSDSPAAAPARGSRPASSAAQVPQPHRTSSTPPPFAPIFTLVDNTSTRTTHHPHVRYIFSDDDPDILTHALAECDIHNTGGDESDPANRAMILDLQSDDQGGYSVAWSSSLSPSWAVLDAQLSHISPPSSEAGSTGGGEGNTEKKPDRLMLRIEGLETTNPESSSELRISGERTGQGSGSGSGSRSGSAHKENDKEEYAGMLDEFDKRMATLRKVVNASEDRRKKVAAKAGVTEEVPEQTPDAKRAADPQAEQSRS
ncbi:hypothetical protein GGR57DRAFT_499246 [Xylariaceae sp. FL1272]|nr:hypothetical protein GGR57DRAFT_499246 [Xylariaceae sp. FL1272]